jgi:hypothetical protein
MQDLENTARRSWVNTYHLWDGGVCYPFPDERPLRIFGVSRCRRPEWL